MNGYKKNPTKDMIMERKILKPDFQHLENQEISVQLFRKNKSTR